MDVNRWIKNGTYKKQVKTTFRLYSEFLLVYEEAYHNLSKGTLKARITRDDRFALQQIITYLTTHTNVTEEEEALKGWRIIWKKWDKLEEYLKKQKELTSVYRNLPRIIEQIKKGGSTPKEIKAQQLDDLLLNIIENQIKQL